jgi:hypothetical protein
MDSPGNKTRNHFLANFPRLRPPDTCQAVSIVVVILAVVVLFAEIGRTALAAGATVPLAAPPVLAVIAAVPDGIGECLENLDGLIGIVALDDQFHAPGNLLVSAVADDNTEA